MKAKTNVTIQDKDGNISKPLLCAWLLVIVEDFGRMHQRSFNVSEIYNGIDLSKYTYVQWIEPTNKAHKLALEKECKLIGTEIKYVKLFG